MHRVFTRPCAALTSSTSITHSPRTLFTQNEIQTKYFDSVKTKQMEKITSTGQLLPDAVILDILKRRVEKGIVEGERGFLLDGFPRTVGEVQAESS